MTSPRSPRIRTRAELERPTSRQWSLHPGTIGAWVAEMDFGTAPAVREALVRAITDDVTGYLSPATTTELGEATAEWMSSRFGWEIDPHRVHPVSDVMAVLAVAIHDYSPAGSAVIVPTPAYMPFLSYIPVLGREVIEVPGIEVDGRWRHDLDAIDRAFAAGAGTLVLCNPHNPTGTVLRRDELLALSRVVEARGGRVFADEIHAPILYPGEHHTPYASVSDAAASHTVTGTSATKGWNIAGLKAAQLIMSSDEDERRYQRFGFSVVHGASTLGVIASIAAYRDGRDWLEEVVDYLDGNRRLLAQLIPEYLPTARYREPSASYLAWLDLGATGVRQNGSGPVPAETLRDRAQVAVTDGALCGRGFEDHVRMTFAMPRDLLETAVIAIGETVREAGSS